MSLLRERLLLDLANYTNHTDIPPSSIGTTPKHHGREKQVNSTKVGCKEDCLRTNPVATHR